MPEELKRYTDYVVVDYNDKKFIFNPYAQGIGLWHYMSAENKPVKIAEKHLQEELNAKFFGTAELPPILERFLKANKKEKEKLNDIAISWLQLKIKALQSNIQNENIPLANKENQKVFISGGMYFYVYDAYWKEELPYWDKFPLMILLERKKFKNGNSGFLGLNLHYLPTDLRIKFLQKLLNLTSKHYNRHTQTIRLRLTYDFLKESIALKEFRPCVKLYLDKQIKSMILPIQAHEWIFAAGLEVDKFQKKGRNTVWKESLQIIKKS